MANHLEQVYFHASQFPDRVAYEYTQSFIQRCINHKFHYHTTQQSQQWLRLHDAYSPTQQSPDYHRAYEQCLHAALDSLRQDQFDLIGLGCGGGEKEVLLHNLLADRPVSMVSYYPVDVSHALAITAARKMRREYPDLSVQSMVCDLLHADDLISYMPRGGAARLITFFGMIPNFTPATILPILNQFLSPGDLLLFSANLTPGDDYALGMKSVLPQYNNTETRTWLMSVLHDAGISNRDGDITVTIDSDTAQQPDITLKKITAYFTVRQSVRLTINGQVIHWQPKERVQLFFSYRYTTPLVRTYLNKYGIEVLDNWEFNNQEEGLYLCRKTGS